jgi:chondroitin 4-sulfotransferase 11
MIVCERRKLVFLHIPKTAGTSLGEALGFGVHIPHRHSVNISTARRYPDFLRFCFVRDPWDRAVSAFLYSKRMAARGVFNGDPARDFLRERGDVDFRTFAAGFLTRSAAAQSLHFREQTHWIRRGEPQFIGRVERMTADVALLARLIGEPIEIRRSNESSADRPYAAHYDTPTRELIGRIYRNDVALLGYGGAGPSGQG